MNHVATTTRSQWSPNYGMRRAPRKLEKIWLSNRYHALPSSLQKCPIARPHVPTFAWLQGARLMCLRKCFYLSLLFLFVLLYQRGNAKSTARATSCKRHFVSHSGNPALPEAKKRILKYGQLCRLRGELSGAALYMLHARPNWCEGRHRHVERSGQTGVPHCSP